MSRPRESAPCPYCGQVPEANLAVTAARAPKAGDVSLCFACVCLSVYTDDGRRAATTAELAEFMTEPAVVDAIASVDQVHRS